MRRNKNNIPVDVTGMKFGRLTAVSLDHKKGHNAYWKCQCECGNYKVISRPQLLSGEGNHCGCFPQAIVNLTSQRFGRLVVLETFSRAPDDDIQWECLCDCGNKTVVRRSSLQSGTTQSCGCLAREETIKRSTTHGQAGEAKTPEYRLWQSAKGRSKKKGISFSLKLEDIVIPEFCPLLGVKLKLGNNKAFAESPSLDRLCSRKGYTRDNVWVISRRANSIKNDASLEELQLLTRNLEKKIKEGLNV